MPEMKLALQVERLRIEKWILLIYVSGFWGDLMCKKPGSVFDLLFMVFMRISSISKVPITFKNFGAMCQT